MPSLCLTFYRPLYELLECLQASFPHNDTLATNCIRLTQACETQDKSLLADIGGCLTPALLAAYLRNDTETFFRTGGAFTEFIGGREVFDLLDSPEKCEYWGTLMETIIRQGIASFALLPKMDTLEKIAGALNGLPGGTGRDPLTVLRALSSDPSSITNVMSLVEGTNGIKDLMGMLSTVMVGLTSTETAPREESTSPSPDPVVAQTTPPQDVPSVDVLGFQEELQPSAIFATAYKNRKKAHQVVQETTMTSISDVVGMITKIPEEDLTTMQDEFKGMNSTDMSDAMNNLCSMMTPSEDTKGLAGSQDPSAIMTAMMAQFGAMSTGTEQSLDP